MGKKLKLKRFLVGLKHMKMQRQRGRLNVIDVFVAVILPEVATILLKRNLFNALLKRARNTPKKTNGSFATSQASSPGRDSLSSKDKRAEMYPIAT